MSTNTATTDTDSGIFHHQTTVFHFNNFFVHNNYYYYLKKILKFSLLVIILSIVIQQILFQSSSLLSERSKMSEQVEAQAQVTDSSEPKQEQESQKNGMSENDNNKLENIKTIYEFTVKDLDGNDVSMSKYKGNVVMIVNVASNCGFTKNNYNQMNELFEKYESKGFRIAAFPCNQFAGQEPGCEADIKEFAKKNNVKFDMYAKIEVNGSNAHPLYRWLKMKLRGIFGTQAIKWNFTKFLINKEGIPYKRYAPTTSPNSIESDIQALLDASA